MAQYYPSTYLQSLTGYIDGGSAISGSGSATQSGRISSAQRTSTRVSSSATSSSNDSANEAAAVRVIGVSAFLGLSGLVTLLILY